MRLEAARRNDSSDSDDSPKKFSPGKGNASSTWKSDSVASRTKGSKGANDSKEADKAPLNITQDLGNPLYNEQLNDLNVTREKLASKVGKSPTGDSIKKRKKSRKGRGAGDDGLSVFSMGTSVVSAGNNQEQQFFKGITVDYGFTMGKPR